MIEANQMGFFFYLFSVGRPILHRPQYLETRTLDFLSCGLQFVTNKAFREKEFIVYELLMSIKMRVAVLFVVSYFSGSKMGGSDNDIIFVSALGKI